MRRLLTLLGSFPLIAASVAAQPAPEDLVRLAAKSRLAAPVVGWCRGEFRPGRAGAYAVAASSTAAAGRYVVLESDATLVELAPFTGRPGLACYTPSEARQLDLTIGRSDTIHGTIAPRWTTTVVCGFVANTTSVCWQYSPDTHVFVDIGGWVT